MFSIKTDDLFVYVSIVLAWSTDKSIIGNKSSTVIHGKKDKQINIDSVMLQYLQRIL